jgi:hypothetical protein
MTQYSHRSQQHRNLIRTLIGGILVGLPLIPAAAATAQQPLNPCPGIYYEEPFNSTRMVPNGCPPNAATRLQMQSGEMPMGRPTMSPAQSPYQGAAPAQPPMPGSQSNAIANVTLSNNGTFNMMLMNKTNAVVSYEVIGQTQRRYLSGGEQVTLQGIPAPATITLTRQDNGFVQVIPVSNNQPGLLAVSLNEDQTPSDQTQGVLQVHQNGQVFVN